MQTAQNFSPTSEAQVQLALRAARGAAGSTLSELGGHGVAEGLFATRAIADRDSSPNQVAGLAGGTALGLEATALAVATAAAVGGGWAHCVQTSSNGKT